LWASVVITALRDEQGALVGFAKVTRDLTQRKMAEEELRRTKDELLKSNAELEEYAAFVSHDLQEPLRKMASFSELLKLRYADKLDDAGKDYIRLIVDGAVRMRALITDVLDYSRIGRAKPPMSELDLSEVYAGVLKDLELQIQESGAQITVEELPKIKGNRQRLARVFQNITSNALKYREPSRPPVIRVSSKRDGARWIVTVADNGIGFNNEQAEVILRPFQRLHSKEKYPGSGIGLAAAKKIALLHGGSLWAEALPGKGAAFHVSLPALP
jgi:light-regulated signal transduction histidine kinase (bacteriophytochrome)